MSLLFDVPLFGGLQLCLYVAQEVVVLSYGHLLGTLSILLHVGLDLLPDLLHRRGITDDLLFGLDKFEGLDSLELPALVCETVLVELVLKFLLPYFCSAAFAQSHSCQRIGWHGRGDEGLRLRDCQGLG